MITHSEAATRRFLALREQAGFPALHLLPGEAEFFEQSAGFQYIANTNETTITQSVELGIKLAGLGSKTGNKIFSFDLRAGLLLLGKFFVLMPNEKVLLGVLEHEHLHFRMAGVPRRVMPVVSDESIAALFRTKS